MLSRLFCVVCKCGAFAAEFTLYALFVGEICSCVFISSLFVFFLVGGCHADTHISTICHKRICLISKSRCIQS